MGSPKRRKRTQENIPQQARITKKRCRGYQRVKSQADSEPEPQTKDSETKSSLLALTVPAKENASPKPSVIHESKVVISCATGIQSPSADLSKFPLPKTSVPTETNASTPSADLSKFPKKFALPEAPVPQEFKVVTPSADLSEFPKGNALKKTCVPTETKVMTPSADLSELPKESALPETSVLTESVLCTICLDTLSAELQDYLQPTYCGHLFHSHCLDRWMRKRRNRFCPVCRDPIDRDYRLRPEKIPIE